MNRIRPFTRYDAVFYHLNETVAIAHGYSFLLLSPPRQPTTARITKATTRAACLATRCHPHCRGIHYNAATHACTAVDADALLLAITHTGSASDWVVLFNLGTLQPVC